MPIELGYMNLVIPIENIEKLYPGGFDQYQRDHEGEFRHDDHLVVREAMSWDEIESFAKECEDFGLVRFAEKEGVKHFQDFCMIDIVPDFPCDWLEGGGFEVFHKYKDKPNI